MSDKLQLPPDAPRVGNLLMVTERIHDWIVRVNPAYDWTWDGPFDTGAIVSVVEVELFADEINYHIQRGDMRFQAISLNMAIEMKREYEVARGIGA